MNKNCHGLPRHVSHHRCTGFPQLSSHGKGSPSSSKHPLNGDLQGSQSTTFILSLWTLSLNVCLFLIPVSLMYQNENMTHISSENWVRSSGLLNYVSPKLHFVSNREQCPYIYTIIESSYISLQLHLPSAISPLSYISPQLHFVSNKEQCPSIHTIIESRHQDSELPHWFLGGHRKGEGQEMCRS